MVTAVIVLFAVAMALMMGVWAWLIVADWRWNAAHPDDLRGPWKDGHLPW